MATGLLVVLVVAVGITVLIYNGLVRLRNQTQNAWRQIDVQLNRRRDLVPNLVEAVKGAMAFERDTLERVVAARARPRQPRAWRRGRMPRTPFLLPWHDCSR
jgi:LemA protein